jgi:hypothetical protein
MLNSEGKSSFASHGVNIPILFLVFNRLDTTKQVFEMIRKASPSRFYVASDGPRDNQTDEKEKVEEVREYILKSVDWSCEVKTLFRENNFGCGKAVSGAITWFFENVEQGIILEDDCLPSLGFFDYCAELLEKYKDNNKVYHIAGHNPLTILESEETYYFARIQHCWGWASWRRAWKQYSYNIDDLDKFIAQGKIKEIFNRRCDQKYWLDIFRQMEKHEIDTWDYQWTYAILKNNGICINPTGNMVKNIGFGINATHTLGKSLFHDKQEIFDIGTIVHPDKIVLDMHIIDEINRKTFKLTWARMVKRKAVDILKYIYNIFFTRQTR